MPKEKGIQPCDTVLFKKRSWLLIRCNEAAKETIIVHRSRKHHSTDGVTYSAVYLEFTEAMQGKCCCRTKVPDEFKTLWTLANWDVIPRWEKDLELLQKI